MSGFDSGGRIIRLVFLFLNFIPLLLSAEEIIVDIEVRPQIYTNLGVGPRSLSFVTKLSEGALSAPKNFFRLSPPTNLPLTLIESRPFYLKVAGQTFAGIEFIYESRGAFRGSLPPRLYVRSNKGLVQKFRIAPFAVVIDEASPAWLFPVLIASMLLIFVLIYTLFRRSRRGPARVERADNESAKETSLK